MIQDWIWYRAQVRIDTFTGPLKKPCFSLSGGRVDGHYVVLMENSKCIF